MHSLLASDRMEEVEGKGWDGMQKVRFIHTADLHLDSPLVGMNQLPEAIFEQVQESTFQSFERIVDKALAEKVDFIIIAGDIYDQHERSLKAQLYFKKQMSRLDEHNIPVYIIHGNHDFTGGSSLHVELPSNVHVFSDEKVERKTFVKDGVPLVNLYGYSYPKRAVTENMSRYYVKRGDAPFHIGLLHGTVAGDSEHEPYCPFRVQDLTEKGFDYWALGHIHKRQLLHNEETVILYPGNIQGRHRKEQGEKGAYLIELTKAGADLQFFSTAPIFFTEKEISLDQYETFSDFIDGMMKVKSELKELHDRVFYTLRFVGVTHLYQHFVKEDVMEDFMELMNEGETGQVFSWLMKVENEAMPVDVHLWKEESFFTTDLQSVLEHYDMEAALQPLMKHATVRKELSSFSEEEKQQILKEAQLLLFHEWLKSNVK